MTDFNDIQTAQGAEAVRDMIAAAQQMSDDPVPPEFADEALALQLVDKHGGMLRYVAAWGKWLIFDGKVWVYDDTLKVFSIVRDICREAAAECEKRESNKTGSKAARIASAQTVAAVEKLARSDRRIAATVEQWDADPWLLNTPDGVIDLHTGKKHPHNANNYLTKMTAVSPSGDCPLWKEFLNTITAGNLQLQDFMQRMSGYALTGLIKEHALFFLYGTGGNGKGVFLNTLTAILKAYAAISSMDTFTASQSERHPTDLAMLRGARIVTAQETEEGRRWAESKIKALTGGDPVTARFMRQDFFTFNPQFKLVIAGKIFFNGDNLLNDFVQKGGNMGGAGSGGWYRWNKKTYLEDCRVLDLRRMRKLEAIPARGWRMGGWQWTDKETQEVLSSIGYEADTRDPANSFLRVHYTLNGEEKMDYRIQLSTTRPHYGGARFWFLCPMTGQRVTKLYLYGGRFISRHACRLTYASQNESRHDRLIRKKWKMQNKVGGQDFPCRPKGMHEKTYERLCDIVFDLEGQADDLFIQRWAHLVKDIKL